MEKLQSIPDLCRWIGCFQTSHVTCCWLVLILRISTVVPALNLRFEPPKLFRCKATGKIRTWGRMHQHTAAYSIADETKSCLWCGGFAKKFFQDYLCKSLQSTVTWQQSDPKPTIRLCESWTTFTRKGNLKKLRPVESYAGSKVKIRMQSKIPWRFGPGKAVPWPHFVQSTNVLWMSICLAFERRLGPVRWRSLNVPGCCGPRFSGLQWFHVRSVRSVRSTLCWYPDIPLLFSAPRAIPIAAPSMQASIKQGQAGSLQWSLQVLPEVPLLDLLHIMLLK